jgi:hypothetical protein
MELLRDIAADGYPTDYLVARVRGRRAALSGGQRPPLAEAASDEAVWGALLAEFDWLRRQMDPPLREMFAPVFMLFGLKTLVLSLRNKAAGRDATVDRLLRHELFADELREALAGAADANAAVSVVAAVLGGAPGGAAGLAAAYAADGLKGLEARVMRDFLASVLAARMHRAVRGFFVAFIDLRNVMTLYKQLRWGFSDAAAFVPGGSLATSRLATASAAGDAACLDDCVREIAGDVARPPAMGEVALESRLLSSLTHRLARRARDGDEVEIVLDYLWTVYVQARNRALRLHAGAGDAVLLEPELVA